MMTHQLRDGTYQCDQDGLTAEQYTAWQRENARALHVFWIGEQFAELAERVKAEDECRRSGAR